MVYFFQTLSLKTRFVGILLLAFPVLALQWLLTGAPWALARLQVLSGGAGLPDRGFWYSPEVLQTQLAAWGAEGRLHYLTILWPTDTAFLAAYGAFLTATTLYLLKKSNPAGPWWYLLPLVPLAGAGFDFLENATVALAAVLPAVGWEPVSWAASFFTSAKWVTLGLAGTVLVLGAVASWVRWGVGRFRVAHPETTLKPGPGDPGLN